MTSSDIVLLLFCLIRFRQQKIPNAAMTTTTAMTTPIPNFAPVERPPDGVEDASEPPVPGEVSPVAVAIKSDCW
jgi:hypothetical protein